MSKKYRPYLSLEMMTRIVSLAEHSIFSSDEFSSSLDKEIINTLQVLILKANHGITQPSFTPIVDKLGIPEVIQSKAEAYEERRFLAGEMTEEEAAAYQAKLMEKINESL